MRVELTDSTPGPTAALVAVLAAYVVGSLTIPFWVPIVKRLTGDCGVLWVRGARVRAFASAVPLRAALARAGGRCSRC